MKNKIIQSVFSNEQELVMTKEIEETLNHIYQDRLDKMRGGEYNENKKRSSIKRLLKSTKQFARKLNRK